MKAEDPSKKKKPDFSSEKGKDLSLLKGASYSNQFDNAITLIDQFFALPRKPSESASEELKLLRSIHSATLVMADTIHRTSLAHKDDIHYMWNEGMKRCFEATSSSLERVLRWTCHRKRMQTRRRQHCRGFAGHEPLSIGDV
eukprot:PhF_6_TR29163/c2_g1_i2/m.42636